MVSALPVLLPTLSLAAAFFALVAGERKGLLAAVAVLAQLVIGGVALSTLLQTLDGAVLVHPLGGWLAPVGIVFVADRLTALLVAVMITVFLAAIVYFFLDHETASHSRSLGLVFLLQTGVFGALVTGDLFDFYVFFELMSLSAYGLVGYRKGPEQVEAALKFAALSLVGSAMMVMGVGAIYAQTGTLAFAQLFELSQTVTSQPLFLFAVGLVLVALCLKCALVPLHFWLPDAHSIAPTAISVLLSGGVVKVGAYGIFRLLGSSAPWVWEEARGVLLFAGAATAVLCALMAVPQKDLKRLFAYSTASQMGYIVAAAALGTVAGVAAALVHAIAHALMKSTLFLGAGAVMSATGQRQWDRMGGMIRLSPALSAAMLIAAMSLAGIPPLVGFSGKLAIFTAMVEEQAWAALLCLVIASALMLYLMVRVWLGIFGGEAVTASVVPSGSKVALAGAMAGLVIVTGLATGPVLTAARAAADDLFSGAAYRAAVLGAPTAEVHRP